MRTLRMTFAIAALSLATACGNAEPTDGASGDAVTGAEQTEGEAVVRAYYAANKNKDTQAREMATIFAEDVEVQAPSIRYLKHKDKLVGRDAFIETAVKVQAVLATIQVREVIPAPDGETFISRIDIPLPNGPLTQVEFFVVKNGRITKFQSYYDAIPLLVALPELKITGLAKELEGFVNRIWDRFRD